MKKLFITLAFTAILGVANAQSILPRSFATACARETVYAMRNFEQVKRQTQSIVSQSAPVVKLPGNGVPVLAPQHVSIPQVRTFEAQRQSLLDLLPKDSSEKQHILDRFLSYVRIESQSVYDADPAAFPMTEGQIAIARFIFDELKTIDKDNIADIKMSPDYYIYVKVPSNIHKEVPSVMFMAHLDVTPEMNGEGINPQPVSRFRLSYSRETSCGLPGPCPADCGTGCRAGRLLTGIRTPAVQAQP